MKLFEIAPSQPAATHVTAKALVDALQRLLPSVRVAPYGQARTTKQHKVVTAVVTVPPNADVEQMYQKIVSMEPQLKQARPDIDTVSVDYDMTSEVSNSEQYIYVKAAFRISGEQQERANFIAAVKKLVAAYPPRTVNPHTENRKTGAVVTLSVNTAALRIADSEHAVEEITDKLIELYGDRIEVDVNPEYTVITFR